ncbi:MAG: nitroreductase [Dehalococcoidia bacterium]|nr:nitroreductase [Dehalococcoidia bacterium]
MNVTECVRQRKSIRAFKSDLVPYRTLRELMESALRAPSWANTQPWQFAIVSGCKLEEIRQEYVKNAEAGVRGNPELAFPQEYPEPFDSRRRFLGRKIYELKGIGRQDVAERKKWGLQGLKLFEAPCCIYIYIERSFCFQANGLNLWPIFDCGLIAENIMLLALEYGLGTIPEAAAATYPDVLHRILEIPDTKLIVLGIAIGYPDWDNIVNKLQSERAPLDNLTRWYGFNPDSD